MMILDVDFYGMIGLKKMIYFSYDTIIKEDTEETKLVIFILKKK